MAQPLEPGDKQDSAERRGEVDPVSALHGQRQQVGRRRQGTPRQNRQQHQKPLEQRNEEKSSHFQTKVRLTTTRLLRWKN